MKRADHHLVQQVLDGEVSAEQFDGFQERLRKEPELVDLYKGYALLQHTLSEEYEDGMSGGAYDAVASRRSWNAGLLLLACSLAVVSALAWLLSRGSFGSMGNVGVATFSVDAVWQIEGPSHPLGGATGIPAGGKLLLRQGRASVSLEPSVTVVLEGPASLALESKSEVELKQGRGYFRLGGSNGGLTVRARDFTAVESGTEFGINCPESASDEIHVFSGKVRVTAAKGGASVDLETGASLAVNGEGKMQRMDSASRPFANHLGRFETVIGGEFVRDDWHLDFGNPVIGGKRFEGLNFTAYRKLPKPEPSDGNSVLLVTIAVVKPDNGTFHTDGWAGMSFFSGGKELLFFGDSFGTRNTWSLDVKQRLPVILPASPVMGPRTVTLRYDSITGDVSLHDGAVPLKSPFCVGRLPVGVKFDEIRLGASAGAALAVDSLQIRVGGN